MVSGTKGLSGRKKFFVAQMAVDKIVRMAEEKVDARGGEGRHTGGAEGMSLTCLKDARIVEEVRNTETRPY